MSAAGPDAFAGLQDGGHYSVILRTPRSHRYAIWHGASQLFVWKGTSEEHHAGLDEIAEVLERVEPPRLPDNWG